MEVKDQPNYGSYGGPPPVQNQPMGHGRQAQWMPTPPTIPNCPPGLEYLSQIDHILIHQQVELLEALTGYESNNQYEIKNSMGQRMYCAAEQNDCCTRNLCGPARSFVITIVDNMGREVNRLSRPYRCSSCWFPCCLQKMQVEAPPGTVIGHIKQNWNPCFPRFTIMNEMEEEVLKLYGPCIPLRCFFDTYFELKTLNKSDIGRISKPWMDPVKETFTDVHFFGASFPMDLDVKMKAVVLGACFLIDFLFMEQTKKK
ncbi:phospholipid scramblase 2-like isoform X2 [Hyperolius riggenbachi]|uniref:phospholipid scramblase 2-like isoform X2 n=1 Tax=Hyperolius riggenbachi TaxID=752182 RepID=UPI0035A394EA